MSLKRNKVKISQMSGKLEGLGGINTNPLTNKFCTRKVKEDSICFFCYSKAMLKAYRKNCVPLFNNNSDLLSSNILSEDQIPRSIKYNLIRFNAHGELINSTHFNNCLNICNKFPTKTFSLFTKRDNFIQNHIKKGGALPSNLVLVYSSHTVNELTPFLPQHFHKNFTVYTEQWLKDNPNKVKINCKKSCNKCKLCYSFNKTTSISELIK